MRRSYALLLLAPLVSGCSQGAEEPAAVSTVATRPEAPGKLVVGPTSIAKTKLSAADPKTEAAQRELDLAIELTRLSAAADDHQRRGYFEQAVATRQKTFERIEGHFGADSWQAKSARLASDNAARLLALDGSRRSIYSAGMQQEASAREMWKNGERKPAADELAGARASVVQLWGPNDYQVANLLDQEADWRQTLGEGPAAEALARHALAIRAKVFPGDHPDKIASISRLGLILQMEQKHADAEPLLADAVAQSARVWGETHAEQSRHLNNLGMLEYDRANLSLAIKTLNQALTIRQQVLPENDPLIGHSLFNLASAQYAAKDYPEASPKLQRALAIFVGVLGESHSMSRRARGNLGMSLMAEKKYTEAAAVMREDYEVAQRAFGANHAITAECLLRIGVLYGNQGMYAQAEPLVKHAAGLLRAAVGVDHPTTQRAVEVASRIHSRLVNSPASEKAGAVQTSAQAPAPAANSQPGPVLITPPASNAPGSLR